MLDREVVERLGELLAKATQYPAWGGWPDPVPSRHGTDHYMIGDAPPYLAAVKRREDAELISAMHRALPELLRVYRAWLDAPRCVLIPGDNPATYEARTLNAHAIHACYTLKGNRIRLVRDGDSGEG